MIVTATANAKGEQRLYLGGKASLECWIEPDPDGHGWSFHVEEAVTGNNLTLDDKRDFARHMLESLAALLETSLTELWTIPYSRIIALHCPNPFLGRRAPSPRKQFLDQGFIPIQPQPTGPPVANSPRLSASPRRNSCR